MPKPTYKSKKNFKAPTPVANKPAQPFMRKTKDDVIVCEGIVTEVANATRCLVRLVGTGNDKIITGIVSGKMRMNNIKILVGDHVTLELSTYDLTKGRITFRHKEPFPRKTNNQS